ncbi:ROK family protein [Streptomyces sp. C10-9-1]|uniref:ROK family transcriptional regulator n=1 Tax=Streptomyces sp. C10-9-1 TaxID=1859285 RepID=UPI003D7530C8
MTTSGAGGRPDLHGPARRRAYHRALLLGLLRRHGPATRQELVRRSGLSVTTVSSLATELESRGLVTQRTVPQGRTGRRPVLVSFNRAAASALAVEVGARHLAVAVGGRSGTAVVERRVLRDRTDDSADASQLTAVVEDAVGGLPSGPEALLGAVVVAAAELPGHAGRPACGPEEEPGPHEVARLLADRWRVPVTVESGAALGALAECSRGREAGARTVLNISCGRRIASGIAVGGALHRGRTGSAGSLGHLVVRPGGRPCGCGRLGCLDAYLDQDALREILGGGRGTDAREAMRRPCPAGLRGADEAPVALLAEAVAAAALIVDPSVVVLGGPLASCGAWLVEPLQSALHALPVPAAPVICSALGWRAPLLGGVDLVLSEAESPEAEPAPGNGAR